MSHRASPQTTSSCRLAARCGQCDGRTLPRAATPLRPSEHNRGLLATMACADGSCTTGKMTLKERGEWRFRAVDVGPCITQGARMLPHDAPTRRVCSECEECENIVASRRHLENSSKYVSPVREWPLASGHMSITTIVLVIANDHQMQLNAFVAVNRPMPRQLRRTFHRTASPRYTSLPLSYTCLPEKTQQCVKNLRHCDMITHRSIPSAIGSLPTLQR